MQGRRDRSRSPIKVDSVGRRRDQNKGPGSDNMQMQINPMMMGNMYQQGNMMIPGGMYPNMMMSNAMMGGNMMPTAGMEMMSSSGMDMMQQTPIDMGGIPNPALPTQPPVDMNLMGGMMMDPSVMGMYSAMGDMSVMAERKEIVLKHCKLTPPEPGAAQPSRRSRPPGCRTIFVGGLPTKIRESVVREIFENYGSIHILRLSKKNFCHIRFDRESSVDAAMTISGYQIKLTDFKEKERDKDDMDTDKDDDNTITGWLHVDFAASRDDQKEYEQLQRHALRVQQAHMQQLNAQQEITTRSLDSRGSSYRRSPSPPRVQLFSTTAMVQLSEKIKNEDHFGSALPTLLAWLERGECSKKTANQFYSMIQATNSHIRRLFNEKVQSEEELQECKERVKNAIQNVITQLEQVAKVFQAASHQRVWDHFTKAQRKNIETWQKMTQEFRSLKEEFNEKFLSEENEYNGYNNRPLEIGNNNDNEIQHLKTENESLKFQLEAYKNEVDVIKLDAQKEMEKFKAQFIARQALQGAMENKNPPLPTPIEKPPPPPPLPDDLDQVVKMKDSVEIACGEAKLIGVMAAFLQVHPYGASLDYVVSYVRALFPAINQATVHHVLQKHGDVFQKTTTGIGANIEHRWAFIAFQKQEEA